MPNTLDTAIAWHYAGGTKDKLDYPYTLLLLAISTPNGRATAPISCCHCCPMLRLTRA
ncbi:hypothetical protein GGF41_007129 [Coemansia sp. RSA 2531]|nr:hypothetical protein GGF41_007129 [Coemansia sp. RSA 2531]